MFRDLITASALVVTAVFCSPVLEAQTRAARMRFEVMDRSGDGAISRDEWQGSARAFTVQDWNGDGMLSGEEVRLGARRNANWEEADHVPNRAERNLSWTPGAFTNLDHNRDGRLTANEWHYDTETFRRVDSNRDDALSREEFLGEGDDDGRDIGFDDLDANNNGRVERGEWHFSSAAFNRDRSQRRRHVESI